MAQRFLIIVFLTIINVFITLGITSNDNKSLHKAEIPNTPSPEWLEYQRERYSHRQVDLNKNNNNVRSENKEFKQAAGVVKENATNHSKVSDKEKIVQISNEKRIHTSARDMTDEAVVADYPESEDDTEAPVDNEDVNENEESLDERDDVNAAGEANNVYIFSGIQVPTLKGFFEFIQSIQRTWVRKARMNFEDKIELLKRLRDNLMRMIEDQYNAIFHPHERRQKRGILGESNLDFPPEAALMTINFLTFATFLVKLVLQVIQIVKSKHYTLTGLGIDTSSLIKKN